MQNQIPDLDIGIMNKDTKESLLRFRDVIYKIQEVHLTLFKKKEKYILGVNGNHNFGLN